MEDSITLYSSPTCPVCQMLKRELTSRNITYKVEEENYDVLKERHLFKLPILQVGDTFMAAPEAVHWLKGRGNN